MGRSEQKVVDQTYLPDETAKHEYRQLQRLSNRVKDHVFRQHRHGRRHDGVADKGDAVRLGSIGLHLVQFGLGLAAVAVESQPGIVEQGNHTTKLPGRR